MKVLMNRACVLGLSVVVLFLSTLPVLFLGACTSRMKYDDYLYRFYGYSEAELVAQWGVPAQITELDADKNLLFRTQNTVQVMTAPAIYQPYFDGKMVEQRLVQAERWESISQRCETTFLMSDGYVLAWEYSGAGCVAPAKVSAEK